ncbi:hypothetical protein C2G38_2201328 [Gigaspora rosea]|uniref:Uncharacterized protein n=1 Tax=Gigaspora rosea TaxID=44941 RepID=A0A397USH7_9GLOM|nr:hypothetical protein C2G38_2201328 [Gigaspora rosea]
MNSTNAARILTPLLNKYNESFGGLYIDVKIALLQLILCGISPIYNRIIIELSHNDDKENEAFLNGTLPFEQFIKIIYSSDDDSDDSLSLRSTSDSPSSRLHTKRHIDLYFQGGEGVVTYINDVPATYQLTTVDFALIEKLNEDYKLNSRIRNSLWGGEPPSLFIGITSTDVRVQIRSIRAGQRLDRYPNDNSRQKRGGYQNKITVAIQPIYRIIESYSLFAHFQFVDLDIYGQLEQ